MAVKRKLSAKRASSSAVNPDTNPQVVDGVQASRASPDSVEVPPAPKRVKKEIATKQDNERAEPGSDFVLDELDHGVPEAENSDAVKLALLRPPPVNSSYLPLPWKGRLGYACLNTYLRYSNPPVFSSRTCRIASILEHRHPLQDPTQIEHPTKNRPDKTKPASEQRGQDWVQELGLANARDIIKMVRWNDKYGIKFMRLSSEMFPFASHLEYGYKLAPFASQTLAAAGKVIAQLGHRVTCHPGQFTQLGSPRTEVVKNAIRDLEYHDEKLTLLNLPEQANRDAVMILHMGGTYGSKEETLERFRKNYASLSASIKRRLVLENDDVSWSVHDLLPICQELNIPLVLDFHHHNIMFDATKVREGTEDVISLFPAIRETWTRKKITQKMHYSEPTPPAITGMQRRKHSPRVATLPPCANDMDLMIEAKDKEQAVFELMRTFKLPGYHLFNNVLPHMRSDENAKPTARKKADANDEVSVVDEDEVGMGGPDGRVYWPPGMEDWLRPKKREVKPKSEESAKSKRPKMTKEIVKKVDKDEEASGPTTQPKRAKKTNVVMEREDEEGAEEEIPPPKPKGRRRARDAGVLTPSPSEDSVLPQPTKRRSARSGRVSYREAEDSA